MQIPFGLCDRCYVIIRSDNITYRDINEKWIDSQQGRQLVEFELATGDGELFRIKRSNRFETLRQEGKRY